MTKESEPSVPVNISPILFESKLSTTNSQSTPSTPEISHWILGSTQSLPLLYLYLSSIVLIKVYMESSHEELLSIVKV